MKKNSREKKTSSEISPALKQEFRNLGALIEDNDYKLSAIAEQYGDIKKALDSHTEVIGTLSVGVTSIKETLDSHTATLESHTEMIGKLAEDITVVKADLKSVKESVIEKVSRKEFVALDKRLLFAESKIK